MPNEWNITAQAATWMTEICNARPELPFSHATVEETVKGSAKRHDLTLFHRTTKKPILTGEVKRPENPDGRNPMSDALLSDAFMKASISGIPYFFTWNVNRCVLWDSFKSGPLTERNLEHFYVLQPPIKKSDELRDGRREAELKKFLNRFLERLAAIVEGGETLPTLPLDEKFLLVWEAALEQPVAQTLAALHHTFGDDKEFTGQLNTWMREKLGLILSDDPDVRADNLETAAKFSCYVLANRILFYKALRRSFKRLRVLRIGNDITTGAALKTLLDNYFQHAREITRDYETIFGGDFGDTLPFLSDAAADSWRDLSQQTDTFDFTQLGYELIGQIFERLLSPEERHRFGQHYTRSEIVDLINAFCIRDADAVVYDPACGGGTFLVRAYARKKDIAGGTLGHQELLSQLLGSDISAYPAHLTTINLATRDLIDAANYPFVLREDFFNVYPGKTTFKLPLAHQGNLLESQQEFPHVDAIVGNPPYIRQEKIGEYYGPNYKARLLKIANEVAPGTNFTGRSDIHCFFFPHAYTFLTEGGRIGFLVSSSWLDTGYGFRLQKFLLDHFRIIALVESSVEPWFTGARVTTIAVILQREDDPQKRASNTVRFVWATRNIAELTQYTGNESARRAAFDTLRDAIEALDGNESFEMPAPYGQNVGVKQGVLEGWRVRLVRQGDLERLGYTGFAAPDEDDNDEDDSEDVSSSESEIVSPTEYTGSKWGLFLRAPDIFFQLLKVGGSRFVPLGQLADVKFGVKSGSDTFFFPRDVTEEELATYPDPHEFYNRRGIARADTKRLRIIEAGDGTRHVVEAEFLRPVVFNLMEINSVQVDAARLKKQILLVNKPKEALVGTHVLKYIEWGESEGFHQTKTCRSRRIWYDLSNARQSDLLWTKAQRYRHIAPLNADGSIANCNLYDVSVDKDVNAEVLAAVLNSTVVALIKHQFGRTMGGDPLLKTEVVDTKMMLVPDPRVASDDVKQRLLNAFERMKHHTIGHLVAVDETTPELSGELAFAERQALDDAILELIGIRDAEKRLAVRNALYEQITKLYRDIRGAERKMQEHRKKAANKSRPTSKTLAREIWASFDTAPVWAKPADFLDADEPRQVYSLPPGKAKLVQQTLFKGAGVQVGDTFLETGDDTRAAYIKSYASAQLWGEVEVPLSAEACDRALAKWKAHVEAQTALFEAEAAARTVDNGLQKRIVEELWKLTRNGGQS